MAMIKCRECGNEMSDHAKMCPNCGVENNIMFCPECDKQLSLKASICPNCGYTFKNNKSLKNDEVNALSLSGMIVGIVSLFIDFFGLVALVSLVLSIIGLTKSNSPKNRTFATIGIICSSIELILKFIQLVGLISSGY